MTTLSNGPRRVHYDPCARTNHETQYDPEYGLRSVCGERGAGIDWADHTGPVDCDECLAYRLLEAIREAVPPIRVDMRPAAVPLILLGAAAYVALRRSRLAVKLFGTSMDPMDPTGVAKVFGCPFDESQIVPTWGWQITLPVERDGAGELWRG